MTNSSPKISIVTPSYNSDLYIEDCIQSVLDQNYPNFEHVIIDGGSTDKTISILQKYSHLKWISEPDKGQSDALNKGFQMATGDIVGWLNADDFYQPNIFTCISRTFAEHLNVDIIYGNWNFVNGKRRLIKRFQTVPFNQKAIIYYGPFIGSTALFFLYLIVEEKILLDVRFKYAMDWEWYARLGKLNKRFLFVNQTFANFRLHGKNQSHKFKQMTDMDRHFTRSRQLAEAYAIKRCYGHCWGNGRVNIFEEASYRFLWWYYKTIISIKKAYYILISEPVSLIKYINQRNKY